MEHEIRDERENQRKDQAVAASEAKEVRKGLTKDMVRKSWNATRFMEEGRTRMERQTALRALWPLGG